MFQRIHQKLGTAGFIISIVALVAALGGGAYAASGGLNGKQKKEVEKIAKKYAGKPGAAGPAGTNGTNGSNGAKGETGAAGAAGVGTKGEKGEKGEAGESVEAVPVATGATECAGNGGAVLEPEGIEICNGSPWGVGSLPEGKTEMGAWAVGANTGPTQFQEVPVSFTVPLAEGEEFSTVNYVAGQNETDRAGSVHNPPVTCLGTAENPSAPPGILCVYQYGGAGGSVQLASSTAMGRAGGALLFETNGETEAAFAHGTWAITAPTSP